MSGLATTAVPERRALVAAAGELATVLRVEVGRLEQDARRFQERRFTMLASEVRILRSRLAKVLVAAEAVARQ